MLCYNYYSSSTPSSRDVAWGPGNKYETAWGLQGIPSPNFNCFLCLVLWSDTIMTICSRKGRHTQEVSTALIIKFRPLALSLGKESLGQSIAEVRNLLGVTSRYPGGECFLWHYFFQADYEQIIPSLDIWEGLILLCYQRCQTSHYTSCHGNARDMGIELVSIPTAFSTFQESCKLA